MDDYSDFNIWKEEEAEREYLSEYREYSLDEVVALCEDLLNKASAQGLQGCFLKFESHREPYEDYLASPSVAACGYRTLNERETAKLEEQKAIESIADELKITFYEASVVKRLRESGKI